MAEKYTTPKQILILDRGSLPCTVSKTGVTVDSDGDYVIKAGTPLYGADLGASRLTTSYTVSSTGATGSETKALGIAKNDIPFDKGASTASGTITFDAIVDVLKIDSTTQALITAAVKSAVPNLQFVNGRTD